MPMPDRFSNLMRQRSSEQQPPLTAADILQHQHRQPTACKTEADHVAQRISTKYVVSPLMGEGKEDRKDRGNRKDGQRTRPPCREDPRCSQRCRQRTRPVVVVVSACCSVMFVSR